jgi:hypothetical protein
MMSLVESIRHSWCARTGPTLLGTTGTVQKIVELDAHRFHIENLSGEDQIMIKGFFLVCHPVLWIRIRKFWLDPNPKKSSDSDTDSDPDSVVAWKFVWKIEDQTLEREKKIFEQNFSLTYRTGFRTHTGTVWKQLEAPFRKIWGQNISLRILIRIRIRTKRFIRSESESKSEKNEFGSTTLVPPKRTGSLRWHNRIFEQPREPQIRWGIIPHTFLCEPMARREKYFILFRYWLKSKGTLPMITSMRLSK